MKLLFKYCERFEPRSHFLNIVTVITCGMRGGAAGPV